MERCRSLTFQIFVFTSLVLISQSLGQKRASAMPTWWRAIVSVQKSEKYVKKSRQAGAEICVKKYDLRWYLHCVIWM